eukprot:XP_014768156.1 PREDICTED: condensin complex subunit 2-like [Octopus bimaculoides]
MANVFATPHVGSPGTTSRRLSLGTPALLTNKDDAEELRERRKSKLMEIQNKHLTSPLTSNKSSPKNSSSSNPLKGLSVSQLTEHYTNCVKLNAENKITTKNAFGLHLIDYMTDLLKGKKLGDFQVAGTTLDASAKIYASRVDAIHSETYKVLSTLSRGNKKKKKDDGDENGESDDNNDDDDDDGGSGSVNVAKKEKKKKRRNTLIETNLKNINVEKLDIDFEMDPLFKSLTSSFAEGNSNLLLSAISCYTDCCDIVLDSSSVIKDIEDKKVHSSYRDSIDVDDIKNHVDKSKFLDAQICPTFSTFEFNDWNEKAEAMRMNDEANPEYAFDVDAELENIPDGYDDGDDYAGEDNDPTEDMVGTASNKHVGDGENILSLRESSLLQKTSTNTTTSLVDFLATAPSEYSFFNVKLLQTWKGPTHWKTHPLARLSNKSSSSKLASKKEKVLLNFSDKRDFTEEFRKGRSCVLTKKKLESLVKENTTLPKILDYEVSSLFSSFLKPNLLVRRQVCSSVNADDLVGDYDYNNSNDKENYCPAYDQAGDDDNCDDTSEDLFGFSCVTSNSSQRSDGNLTNVGGDMSKLSTLDGDGLIAQPHKVAKININYAKTAKKIDVRRLKESMWKLLSSTSENKVRFLFFIVVVVVIVKYLFCSEFRFS